MGQSDLESLLLITSLRTTGLIVSQVAQVYVPGNKIIQSSIIQSSLYLANL